ncbi:Minichromosome loss protein, Mcl1, middle region [Popillia japonica]|uniref:Minichromosome loss protein, Mcl1, middle region n=1 Tax=Popillia japonica TaxID=7064 RepID=A0AAW1IR50_POPJA
MGPEPELQFDKESSAPSSRPRTPEVPLQAAFMPSSTPEHLNPRYLCWNDVGIVRAYGASEDDSKSIEVEFHDATFHNSMMMQNYQNYTMASLNTSALAVANSEQITIIPLTSSVKEWSLKVEDGREILCIAASSKLVCFSTSNYLVHLCTVYGTQKAVISIPGPVVSMAAFEDVLLIAYHTSLPRKDDQCISMMLVRFEGLSVLNKNMPCPLQPESNLFWLGFSDVGTPASLDSNGMLYLFPLASNIWIPFCDTTKQRKGISDGFFVTAVFESCQNVRGIRCKGSNYPGFVPRPTLSELPLEPPFIEIATEKSQMEANLFMWKVLQVEDVDKKFVETGLKTFVLACKNNLDLRALELIEMLENPQILSLALKYAAKLDKRRMVEKLTELASKVDFNGSDIIRRTEITSSATTPKHIIRPNRKLTLSSSSKLVSRTKSLTQQSKQSQNTPNDSEQAPSTPGINASTADITLQDQRHKDDCLTPSFLNSSLTDTTVNSQESLFGDDEPKNPFLKGLKQSKPTAQNPLSLTDKFAGYDVGKKENKPANDVTDKRKQPDTPDLNPQKEKQRKLDRFMFSNRK